MNGKTKKFQFNNVQLVLDSEILPRAFAASFNSIMYN